MKRTTNRKGDPIDEYEFASSSSSTIYKVQRVVATGDLSCSCRGWTFKRGEQPRSCKHTQEVGQWAPANARPSGPGSTDALRASAALIRERERADAAATQQERLRAAQERLRAAREPRWSASSFDMNWNPPARTPPRAVPGPLDTLQIVQTTRRRKIETDED